VPAGTTLTNTVSGGYNITTAGQTIDKWHITGDVTVNAANVVIKNSQIDGVIQNSSTNLTVSDSTIGPASGCIVTPSILSSNYTALRLHLRGHDDGFRAGGPNVTIRDSYVKNCGNASSHADGIQDYPWTKNLVLDHNTFDLCGAWTADRSQPCFINGMNAAIFIHSDPRQPTGWSSTDVTISNNLSMGGGYIVYLYPHDGMDSTYNGFWKVFGNRVVDGTWAFAPYETEGQCAKVDQWTDNTVVTIDTDYNITSTVATKPCPA
jgi:hypothetical protein